MKGVLQMFIKKFRCVHGEIVIKASDASSDDSSKEIELRSREDAIPALYDAIKKLEPSWRELLQLPDNWATKAVTIVGVTWTRNSKTGIRGAVISGQVALETAHSPANISTPHLPYEVGENANDDGPTANPTLPTATIKRLNKLEALVTQYYNGDRAQERMLD